MSRKARKNKAKPVQGELITQPLAALPKAARREFEAFRREVKTLRARYDAAQTTDHNAQHWAMADGMSARAAHNAGVRKRIRDRARYEVENNSWLSGIVNTLANHTIGIGPRLQILHSNAEACKRVQRAWARWAKEVDLTKKLLLIKTSETTAGEVFALLTRNKKYWPITLDVRLYEPEQVSNPHAGWQDPAIDDGIHLDSNGNPDSYYFLQHHPGDPQFAAMITNWGEWYERKDVLHYFRSTRPGQLRGVSPLTPALELVIILRRFTLAAMKASETAASHTSILKSTSTGVEAAGSPADFAAIEIEHGMMTTLPEGWDIQQMDAKHPNTTYEMVVRVMLNEIARCISMPYNIAACNSAGYNYSSGRLDHQTYYKSIEVDQSQLETDVLNRIFAAWLDEATYVDGLLDGLPPMAELDWEWCWDAYPVIDERVDAEASQTRLKAGLSTLPLEWRRQGYSDFEGQQAKGAEALGATVSQYQKLLQFQLFGMTIDDLPAEVATPVAGAVATDGAAAVQDTALNGAQIAGILSIINQVVAGQLPVDSAGPLIGAAFPLIDSKIVEEILAPLRDFKPPLLADGTPNPALAPAATEIDGKPAASAGVYTGLKRNDFKNNQKAIGDVLNAFIGGASEAITKIALGRLGLTPDDITTLIEDARDGIVDNPDLQGQPAEQVTA